MPERVAAFEIVRAEDGTLSCVGSSMGSVLAVHDHTTVGGLLARAGELVVHAMRDHERMRALAAEETDTRAYVP